MIFQPRQILQNRIWHLNCGTLHPLGGRLIRDNVRARVDGEIVCHVLVVEIADGLALVDTGLGTQDVRAGSRRLPWLFKVAMRPEAALENTAMFQVQKLGFEVSDVKHIVLTHLDVDHVGGLADFPEAEVHVSSREWEAAHRKRFSRYNPAQWSHLTPEKLHLHGGEAGEEMVDWFGLDAWRLNEKLGKNWLLVPLPGHTEGHCGVAIETEHGWLLHAGDAYFHSASLDSEGQSRVPSGLRWFERLASVDYQQVEKSRQALQELASREPSIQIFSTHDPLELWEFGRRRR